MKNILMCRPTYYQIKYLINPWMKIGAVNEKKALVQWNNLESIYKNLGIKVWVINQQKNFPDMVFCADQGIVRNNKILLSNFKFKERKLESQIYEKWYKNYGLKILRLPKKAFFEGGGETIGWMDKLFVGTGFRTNSLAIEEISKQLNIPVLQLELIDDRFYHLDTCFFVLNDQTAFYYPPAFSKQSIALIKKYIPKAIIFQKDDVLNFAANSVVVDKSVIMQSGNIRFSKLIKDLDYKPIMTEVSEFIKAGGGIHCLTGNLDGI